MINCGKADTFSWGPQRKFTSRFSATLQSLAPLWYQEAYTQKSWDHLTTLLLQMQNATPLLGTVRFRLSAPYDGNFLSRNQSAKYSSAWLPLAEPVRHQALTKGRIVEFRLSMEIEQDGGWVVWVFVYAGWGYRMQQSFGVGH